jgi:hypothetical protein
MATSTIVVREGVVTETGFIMKPYSKHAVIVGIQVGNNWRAHERYEGPRGAILNVELRYKPCGEPDHQVGKIIEAKNMDDLKKLLVEWKSAAPASVSARKFNWYRALIG